VVDEKRKEVGTQTETIEDKVLRRKQREVGRQTNAKLNETAIAKRKEISLIVDMQDKRKKPRQGSSLYTEACVGKDSKGNQRRSTGPASLALYLSESIFTASTHLQPMTFLSNGLKTMSHTSFLTRLSNSFNIAAVHF
jgi:hypothetical protein